MLYDHIDLRVTDLEKVRPLYDALMTAMGYTHVDEDGENINYHQPPKRRDREFFGLMRDSGHRPDGSRVALRASSRGEVDRLAEIARTAGARAFEAPENYSPESPWYYAAFFEDADGNKLEICYRE
jgi:catechol 2,3-dioxygenase-like lactoylglutathione lyase family enzyme